MSQLQITYTEEYPSNRWNPAGWTTNDDLFIESANSKFNLDIAEMTELTITYAGLDDWSAVQSYIQTIRPTAVIAII